MRLTLERRNAPMQGAKPEGEAEGVGRASLRLTLNVIDGSAGSLVLGKDEMLEHAL